VIVKRGKTWGVSVYDPALGRKRWVGTFRTLGEARDASVVLAGVEDSVG